MFPGMSAEQLFKPVSVKNEQPALETQNPQSTAHEVDTQGMQLITSGGDLVAALIRVVRSAHDCLVAVGSRSREPSYLQEIELALKSNPDLTHYRILIGLPHSQVLKDHLLRLVELRSPPPNRNRRKTLHIGILYDTVHVYERFFVASEQLAVTTIPSVNSPTNFDTGILFQDAAYVQGLLQHGKALYGRQKLETVESINELEVLQ
jgi:hypothetical protein